MIKRALENELQHLTGESRGDLPPATLDPLLGFKVDVWHSSQLATIDRLRREGAGRTRPLRVTFLVPDTSLWDVFASIFSDMKHDTRFAPSVIAFRRRGVVSHLEAEEVENFFAVRGIEVRLASFDDTEPDPLKTTDVDVLFYTLGSVAYPPAFQIEFNSLRFLTCYLPYGFLLAREYDYQFNQEFHHAAWRVFAATERERALYQYFSHRKASNITLTGYPKFDSLFNEPHRCHGRATVIWAPHWTIGAIYPRLNLGLFDRICMDMLKLIDDYPSIDFLFKPHPTLAHALAQTSFMPPKSYETYLSMLRARNNVSIWEHGDYGHIFARSAAMITDSVSFLAEYLIADRPLLFLDRPERARLSPLGEEIIDLHYSGRSLEDIRAFIDAQVISSRDPKSATRNVRSQAILGLEGGRASMRVLGALLAEVDAAE